MEKLAARAGGWCLRASGLGGLKAFFQESVEHIAGASCFASFRVGLF
jgi:hypothetical protein